MTPIRTKCFPLFSFMHFIAWLIPWLWTCESRAYSQTQREISSRGESTILDAKTDEFMSMSKDDFKYLTQEEAEQIIGRFEEIPQSYDRLLFWTGIPRKWAQRWADDHGMLTFSSAMGPLMDSTDKRCLRRIKKPKIWSKYIKGACGIFARYACKRGIVRVLTLPPYWAKFIRPQSTYRNIEEPVLKGKSGCCGAVQINAVYLLTTLEEVEYQTWPENRIPERLSCRGVGSFSFRLPPWTQKAVDTAAKSLRYNVVSLTASTTPKPATVSIVLQGSVKVAGEPPTAEQPRGGKESRSNTNGQGVIQSKSSQPRENELQPQSQRPLSKKKQQQQQQTQLSQGKDQQLQNQQPQSKEKQPQTQQSPSKNKQPQIQLSQSKNQKPQSQQTQSKKQRPQIPQTSSKKKQPQAQESSNKKKQPKPQQSSSKKEQLQKQQTQNQQRESKKPGPQNSKQPQQGKQLQGSKQLMIKGGV